jgi:hypothetical protein
MVYAYIYRYDEGYNQMIDKEVNYYLESLEYKKLLIMAMHHQSESSMLVGLWVDGKFFHSL